MTIGWFGNERVDYITYDTKGIWRCYEIKVSKSDFYSKAKKSFVGHFNYYVLPSEELYEQVKADVPKHVGVYIGRNLVKRAKKQDLQMDEQVMKDSMIRSLYREAEKVIKSDNPAVVESLNKQLYRMTKDRDEYRRKYQELMNIGYRKYGSRWYKEDDIS